jgi:CRISPR-associated protein Cmr1
MRTPPVRTPDLETLRAQTKTAFVADTLSLEVELITPLFGGGVIPKKLDEVCWLRASEVKAGLRFWWRAIYGHSYPTIKELHEEEAKRFGSAKVNNSVASPVAVKVKETRRTAPPLCADLIKDARKIVYFTGMKMKKTDPPGADLLAVGARASVTIIFRNGFETMMRQEILRAFVAWLVFGGVGARTRRGAGSIAPVDRLEGIKVGYPHSPETLDSFLREISLPAPDFSGDYFSLHNNASILRTTTELSAESAQVRAADHWRSFRQNRRHHGQWSGGVGDYGQNRWPEADLVRDVTEAPLGNHRCHIHHKGLRQVPRALLGLPLILHFPGQSKESDYQIVHSHSDRYASPIWIGVTRTWGKTNPLYFGLVVVTPFLLKSSDLRFKITHMGRQLETGPLRAAYPDPRPPLTKHEPDAWQVRDATHMVQQVVAAFQQPGRGHESVTAPHFEIIR